MVRNHAIAIGINQYEFLQPLRYAKRDALLMQEFLGQEAGFEQVYFFSDDSPPIDGNSTRPFRSNLLKVLREKFEHPSLGDGDNFWFFFSGHGIRHADRDYLMPMDGDPRNIEETAIPINHITERLRRCGADNVVLILDACRNQPNLPKTGEGIGEQTKQKAQQTGVVSIFSCSPSQFSYEIAAIEQGAFTKALLEGLGIQGRCATVERLNQYLTQRVPELVRELYNSSVSQTPYTIAEPITKSHLILMPRHTTLQDVSTLKQDAYKAEVNRDFALARQLWIRVLAVSYADMDAIEAITRIAQTPHSSTPTPPISSTPSTGRRDAAPPPPVIPTFEFDVATFTIQTSGLFGRDKKLVVQKQRQRAEYFTENLGNGIMLDLVSIPGGSFMMGSPESEEGRTDRESPQHQVTIAPFHMGKYPVTQAQWQAVAALSEIDRPLEPDPSHFKGKDRPVEKISWWEAIEFCARLSQKTGKDYRLPSEAEWEYACRAKTTTPFHFGETIATDSANYDGNHIYGSGSKGVYREETTPVGSFKVANAFGLFDMHGNVWEWCADHWHENYQGAPGDGKAWLSKNDNQKRMLRGGSWYDYLQDCRSAHRDSVAPYDRYYGLGLRVVYTAASALLYQN